MSDERTSVVYEPVSYPLYEIADDYRRLLDTIAGQDGEITPEQDTLFAGLEGKFEGKVDAICKLRAERLAAVAGLQREISRLQARMRAGQNQAKRLKDYLQRCLETAGVDAVKTTFASATMQPSPPMAEWRGEPDAYPAGFFKVIPTTLVFDRDAALEAYRKGRDLPAGVVVRRGRHLVIR